MADPEQTLLDYLGSTGQQPVGGDSPQAPLPVPSPADVANMNAATFPAVAPPPITQSNWFSLSGIVLEAVTEQIFNQQYRVPSAPVGGAHVPVKIQFFQEYDGNDYEISELWYAPSPPSLAQVVAYVNAKNAICGTNTLVDRVRVSTIGTRFAFTNFTKALMAGNGMTSRKGTFTVGAADEGSTEPDDALDVTVKSTNGGVIRVKRYQLRGIPDAVITQGGTFTDPGGRWTPLFRSYANVIRSNGWGWYGQPVNPVKLQITNMTAVAGIVTVTINGALPAPPGGATTYRFSARIAGLPQPYRLFNRAITMQYASPTTATTLRVFPYPQAAYPGGGTLQVTSITTASPFYAVDLTDVLVPGSGFQVNGVGERKAGKNPLLHPGRRRNVPLS